MRVKEKFQQVELFVNRGLELIKQGDFLTVIRHFQNTEFAASLNWDLVTMEGPRLKQTLDDEQIANIFAISALNSRFDYGYKGSREHPTIFLCSPSISPLIERPNVHKWLSIEIALICAEEWVHGLQFLNNNQPLAGFIDLESDVAAYLKNHGVHLTDEFLARYNRKVDLEPKPTVS